MAASYSGGMSAAVLRLKVTLGGMAPKALRRIEVPPTSSSIGAKVIISVCVSDRDISDQRIAPPDVRSRGAATFD